jgi:3-deoxy-D-manno-octulosonic-acid transferase
LSGRLWLILYNTLWRALLPLALGRLLLRGIRARGYWRRWGERLGWAPFGPLHGSIWIHAVSVGEVMAALPLIHSLAEQHPDRPVVVTTTTPTGSQRVRDKLGDSVHHCYLPLDLPGPVRRFLGRARPALAVILETELWPNLLLAARRRGVPVVVANGRLSARSLRGYRRVRGLVTPVLAGVHIEAQSEADAERFRALGAPSVAVAGNLKYDREPDADARERGRALRAEWGQRPVWIAASTREGEEEAVLGAHGLVREAHPDALLVLVPRHPERFEAVAELVTREGWVRARRSVGEAVTAATAVYVADTMGELEMLYATADVAFVGGSLVPTGGQNPLEPAALGLPILYGPHRFHFAEVSERLAEAGALRGVEGPESLGRSVAALLDDGERRQEVGERARGVVAANRGARAHLMGVCERLLTQGQDSA